MYTVHGHQCEIKIAKPKDYKTRMLQDGRHRIRWVELKIFPSLGRNHCSERVPVGRKLGGLFCEKKLG